MVSKRPVLHTNNRIYGLPVVHKGRVFAGRRGGRFLLVLLLAALMVLGLCACGGNSEDPPAEETSAPSETPEASPGPEPTPEPTPQPTPEPQTLEGTFTCLDPERYQDERAPFLELRADGTFSFSINLADARPLGVLTGTYSLEQGVLTATMLERDCAEYVGERLSVFSFQVDRDNYLLYQGNTVGLTRSGDVFTREGAPEYVAPTPEPSPTPESSPEPQESPGTGGGDAKEEEPSTSGGIDPGALNRGY